MNTWHERLAEFFSVSQSLPPQNVNVEFLYPFDDDSSLYVFSDGIFSGKDFLWKGLKVCNVSHWRFKQSELDLG